MRAIRILALLVPLLGAAGAARAAEADDDRFVTGVLALVLQIVHEAAVSPDPGAAQKGVDRILSGENAQANRLAAGLIADALEDVPAEQRLLLLAIGRDLAAIARRERERAADEAARSLPPAR
jgi:hypothetical protein